MSALRWGLAGASDIAATRMIPAMRRLGHEVVAVFSSSAERAGAYAAQHGIQHPVSTLDALLTRDDVDAIYISTTNELHCPQTLAAAAAGKHVLCEKPLALSMADAWSMVAACDAASVVLAANHHMPGATTHSEVRRLVAAGAVGRPLAVRVFHAVQLPERLRGWRLQEKNAGGGVILDLTCHDASVLNPLLGTPVEATSIAVCQGDWDGTTPDAVMSSIRYPDDVLAQTHDAFTVAHAGTGFEVHGTEGSLVATGVMAQDPVGTVALRDSAGTREIELPERPDLYEMVLGSFAAAVAGEGAPSVSGVDGARSLAVALAVEEAARSGRAVPIDAEPPSQTG